MPVWSADVDTVVGGGADQLSQPVAGDLAVAGLTAGFVHLQDQRAVLGPAPPGQTFQAGLYRFRQTGAAFRLEPQFDRRGDLVHILPARPRGANELFGQFPVLQRDRVVDPEHPCPRWLSQP